MYDVIVIGGGHAGCEACLATSKMGLKTLLVTGNLNMVGSMPCNPSIGGPAKGVVVREIDALGGYQGKNADLCQIQTKMLNSSKGPAVRALRFQEDKILINDAIKRLDVKLQEVVVLNYFEDMSQTQIANKLGISQMQVSRRLKKALTMLLNILSEKERI